MPTGSIAKPGKATTVEDSKSWLPATWAQTQYQFPKAVSTKNPGGLLDKFHGLPATTTLFSRLGWEKSRRLGRRPVFLLGSPYQKTLPIAPERRCARVSRNQY